MQTFFFPVDNFSPRFNIHWWFLLEWFYTTVVAKWWFSNPTTHSVFVSTQHFTVISGPSFSPFYILLFSLLVLTHGFLDFQLSFFTIVLFWCLNCPRLSHRSLFSWLLSMPLSFFVSTSLLSRITGYSKLIVYLSCLNLRISCCSRKPWFLLVGNGIWDQGMGTKCTHYYWDVFAPGPFK